MKYYIESKDIAQYWEEIGYEPNIDTQLYCIANNDSLTLKESLDAYEAVAAEAGEKSAYLSTYVEAARQMFERFAKDELSEYVVYSFNEIYAADHTIHDGRRQYFNSLYELLFHVRKRCEALQIGEAEIYTDKVYPKENCLQIGVSYRFKNDKFEPRRVYWVDDPSPYTFYSLDKVKIPTPFKPGDVLVDNSDCVGVVGSEPNTSYYLSCLGGLTKTNSYYPIDESRLSQDEVDALSDKFAPLIEVSKYLKEGAPIPEEIQETIYDNTREVYTEPEVF